MYMYSKTFVLLSILRENVKILSLILFHSTSLFTLWRLLLGQDELAIQNFLNNFNIAQN